MNATNPTTAEQVLGAMRESARRMAADLDAAAKGTGPRSSSAYATSVRKIAHTFPVSVEVLLASGAITEEEARERGWTPPPPIPRHRKIKWALQSWWYDHKPHVHLGPCDHEDCV